MISSADAGSAGYKCFCWLGSTVDSYLWKENIVFYSKKKRCCWVWRILASLGSYSQIEQTLKLDKNSLWWHAARVSPHSLGWQIMESWNELVLEAPEWQIPEIPTVRVSQELTQVAEFPHWEAWLRAWHGLESLGRFFGREAVAILHPACLHRRNVVKMPDNGVESAQGISISTELHLCNADTSVLLWIPSHLHWGPSYVGSFLQQLDQTLLSWKNGALDTTTVPTKFLLVIYYRWKFIFPDLKLWIQLNWRLGPGDL